jgi:hypothetical protein
LILPIIKAIEETLQTSRLLMQGIFDAGPFLYKLWTGTTLSDLKMPKV